MERDGERRAERRLRYRWPVRFAAKTGGKAISGQMFDISSEGMAFLFHAREDCPRRDQPITVNFGVPHFDSSDSFDTAFFNRAGRVCRVDNLTSKVNRVAVQFSEPLFFKPGEQDIGDSDAQRRLRTRAQAVVASKEESANYAEALARAEEEIRMYVSAQAQVRKKLKAELKAQAKARQKAETEAQARAKAEAEAKSQAQLRVQAAGRARAEAEKRTRIEQEARQKARIYEEQLAKVKAEAARDIARIEAETAHKVAQARAEAKADLREQAKSQEKDGKGMKQRVQKPPRSGLVKKVDDFITDRSKIF